jgi:hypothetical protein
MDTVLERGDNSNLKAALIGNGWNNMRDLVGITNTQIESLQYAVQRTTGTGEDEVTESVMTTIIAPDQNLLRWLRAYYRHCHAEGNPITDWNRVTADEFDAFRINPENELESFEAPRVRSSSAVPVMSTPLRTQHATSATTTPRIATPAELFRRGIKRDTSLFPTLQDERFNDSWHRSFINQARAQGLSDVLVSTFRPDGDEQIELFREKQNFMYAVCSSRRYLPTRERQLSDDMKWMLMRRKHMPSWWNTIFVLQRP